VVGGDYVRGECCVCSALGLEPFRGVVYIAEVVNIMSGSDCGISIMGVVLAWKKIACWLVIGGEEMY